MALKALRLEDEEAKQKRTYLHACKLLNKNHKDKFLIINTSQEDLPTMLKDDLVHGMVVNCNTCNASCADSAYHAPPLEVVLSVCRSAQSWLSVGEEGQVVVLHCDLGHTALVAACLLLYLRVWSPSNQGQAHANYSNLVSTLAEGKDGAGFPYLQMRFLDEYMRFLLSFHSNPELLAAANARIGQKRILRGVIIRQAPIRLTPLHTLFDGAVSVNQTEVEWLISSFGQLVEIEPNLQAPPGCVNSRNRRTFSGQYTQNNRARSRTHNTYGRRTIRGIGNGSEGGREDERLSRTREQRTEILTTGDNCNERRDHDIPVRRRSAGNTLGSSHESTHSDSNHQNVIVHGHDNSNEGLTEDVDVAMGAENNCEMGERCPCVFNPVVIVMEGNNLKASSMTGGVCSTVKSRGGTQDCAIGFDVPVKGNVTIRLYQAQTQAPNRKLCEVSVDVGLISEELARATVSFSQHEMMFEKQKDFNCNFSISLIFGEAGDLDKKEDPSIQHLTCRHAKSKRIDTHRGDRTPTPSNSQARTNTHMSESDTETQPGSHHRGVVIGENTTSSTNRLEEVLDETPTGPVNNELLTDSLNEASEMPEPTEGESDGQYAERLQVYFDQEAIRTRLSSSESTESFPDTSEVLISEESETRHAEHMMNDALLAASMQASLDHHYMPDDQNARWVIIAHSLPVVLYRPPSHASLQNIREPEEDECQVCKSAFENGERLKILPCIHRYHEQCISRWLWLKGTCPVCLYSLDNVLKDSPKQKPLVETNA
eukprot:CFRG5242T1